MARKSQAAFARKKVYAQTWHATRSEAEREARRARDRARYAETKEARSEAGKAKRIADALAGKVAVYSERWKASRARANAAFLARNPGYVSVAREKRRAAKLNATPLWLSDFDKAAIARWYRLASEQGLTVDHIIPLKGKTVCGLHVPWNMQLLTKEENSRKNNRLLLQEAA